MFISKDSVNGEDSLLVRATGTQEAVQVDEYEDPLADVFGSASSPMAHPLDRTIASEAPSDIPRLRSVHVTNGYREGIAQGKEQTIQAGFDEGYALGAEFGVLAGQITGVLEGLVAAAVKAKEGPLVDRRAAVQQLLQSARRELDTAQLFSSTFFSEDGVWRYPVGSEHSEDEVSFRIVAASHPTIRGWLQIVADAATSCGIAKRKPTSDQTDLGKSG